LKRRIREAFYIGVLDILPLIRDPLMLVMLSLIAFMPVVFISVFAGGKMAIQSLVGAIVLTLFFGGIQVAQSTYFNKHWFRFQDIYVASPVSPTSYAMGLSLSTLIGSLPAVILAIGILFFTWSMTIFSALMLLLVSLILWLATVFLGFSIGASIKNTRWANNLPQLIGFIFGFLPPIYYPLNMLPSYLQPIAMLIPTTHGAQLAKYYLGLISLPLWQVIFGWIYLVGFLLIMIVLARRWAKWVDP
jgi:ABC-2 type transport system permease protein